MSAKALVYLAVVLVTAACAVHAQERIQMCGRELIRLAVSSCGNSRLRRSIPDLEAGQHQYTPQWYQNPFQEEFQATDTLENPQETDGEKGLFSSYALSSRIRRAVGTISDICCEKGCSMKELIQFC